MVSEKLRGYILKRRNELVAEERTDLQCARLIEGELLTKAPGAPLLEKTDVPTASQIAKFISGAVERGLLEPNPRKRTTSVPVHNLSNARKISRSLMMRRGMTDGQIAERMAVLESRNGRVVTAAMIHNWIRENLYEGNVPFNRNNPVTIEYDIALIEKERTRLMAEGLSDSIIAEFLAGQNKDKGWKKDEVYDRINGRTSNRSDRSGGWPRNPNNVAFRDEQGLAAMREKYRIFLTDEAGRRREAEVRRPHAVEVGGKRITVVVRRNGNGARPSA